MENKRNLRIKQAIHLALGVGLSSTLAPAVTYAADEAAELERVQVTGSRISRLDIEGATPVVTITREDLDNSGFQSVADFLRTSSFNSFGSFRESSGNTWQGQATLNLRGVGSNRTLILINGKRLPGSPVTDGQIQNLNVIPFAAVERIEVLSDGASAIYGSDAIGGVVNIILRKDFEGGELTVRGTDPDRPGGAERGISLVAGFGGDRGRVTFGMEADHQDTTLNRDRWFTANQFLGGDPTDMTNYNNLSTYGRNIQDRSAGADSTFIAYPMISGVDFVPANRNPLTGAYGGMADIESGEDVCGLYGEGFWSDILFDPAWTDDPATPGDEGDYYCRYDYTGVAATTAQLDRLSAFMTAEYEISSDLRFTSQIMAARVESWGRYAPAAAPVDWIAAPLPAEEITYNGEQYVLNPIDVGDRIYMRWNNTGPARDSWQYDYQYDLQVGLEGFHEGIQWNVNYQYDLYDMSEWGNGYIHNLGVARAAALGWDPRHPDQQQYTDINGVNALGQIAANSNRRAQMIMQRTDVGAQFDGFMMGGGAALFYVGGEYRYEQYFDETLAQMNVFNIGGTSGGSSGGSRSTWALFAEGSLPITSAFELTPAVRYDSYSDFGSNVSYKLAARYQPVDYWLLRASYGTGFRAPSLDELYQAPSQSFEFADDLVLCELQGIDASACLAQTDQQYETYFNANPDLGPEESNQYLIGTVFDFNQYNGINLTLSLDYYYTEVENVVTGIGTQDAFWLENLGLLAEYPAVQLDRLANGRFEVLQTAPINFAEFNTSGLDFRANYGVSLGAAGELSVGLNTSYILEYNQADQLLGPLVDISGRRDVPGWRAGLDIGWTLGRHTVALNTFFIPSQCEAEMLNPNADANQLNTLYNVCFVDPETGDTPRVDSYTHTNLIYSFEAPWNARIMVGVNNLTDEDPPLDRNNAYSADLYDLTSRAYVASYTQRF